MRDNDFVVEVLINYYYLYYCNYYNSTMNFFLQMQNEMLYNYVGNCDVSKLNVGRKCCFSPKQRENFNLQRLLCTYCLALNQLPKS